MPVPLRCTSCQAVMAVPDATSRRPNACPKCGGQLSELRPLRDSRYITVPKPSTPASPTATTVRKRREPPPAQPPAPAYKTVADDYTQSLLISLALLFGSVSVPLAAVAILSPLAKPTSAMGLLLGLSAWWRARQPDAELGQSRPIAVSILCLGLLIFVGSWRAYREWVPQTAPPTNPDLRSVIATGATVAAPAKPVDSEAWVDASVSAVQQNDVRVRVVSAIVGSVKFKTLPPDPGPNVKRLQIALRLTSVNYKQPIAYESWADPVWPAGKFEPRLTDSLNRVYRRVTFPPGAELEGVSPGRILSGGKPVNDLLIYETPPLDQIAYLRLELPGAAIGATGLIRLEIPRVWITISED